MYTCSGFVPKTSIGAKTSAMAAPADMQNRAPLEIHGQAATAASGRNVATALASGCHSRWAGISRYTLRSVVHTLCQPLDSVGRL